MKTLFINVSMLTLLILLLVSFGLTSNSAGAHHTSQGASYWYNWCAGPLGQMLVSENCSDLISNHDQFGHGLSKEGWRVAYCLGGGLLSVGVPQAQLETIANAMHIRCG